MPSQTLGDEFETVEEYGRTFVRSKKYVMPNDSIELDRLDVQHTLIKAIMGGKLALAPIEDMRLDNVMDLATGSGTWAIEFAQQHPSSKVIGTDITPVCATDDTPHNYTFVMEDATGPWNHPEPFDFIHGCDLLLCFQDPKSIFQKAYDNLAPGGYFEMQDVLLPGLFATPPPENSAMVRWSKVSMDAFVKGGTPVTNPHHYTRWFREVGFEDVQTHKFFVPHGTWPDDPRLAQIGTWSMLNFIIALEGWTFRNLARVGWTQEQTNELIEEVKIELQTEKVKSYREWQVVYGRKPLK